MDEQFNHQSQKQSRKKLFFCETPYQLIVALCIKEQFTNKSDSADIMIADTFNGHELVAEQLRHQHFFDNVIDVKIKDVISSKNMTDYINKFHSIAFPSQFVKKRIKSHLPLYDELYCWNYDIATASIRSYYALKNHKLKLYLFEEGYASYLPIDEVAKIKKTLRLLELRNKIIGIGYANRDHLDGLILFEPKNLIYQPKCKVYKLSRNTLYKPNIKKLVAELFNTADSIKTYDKKIIFFEEAMINECSNFNDEEIVNKIADAVGKENLIVKLHPRSPIDRFSKHGIKTLGSDGVPWEALVCTGNFSDKVLISIGSGAIVSSNLLLGDHMQGFLLFNYLKPNLPYMSDRYKAFWDKIESHDNSCGIHIPENEETFLKTLKEESI